MTLLIVLSHQGQLPVQQHVLQVMILSPFAGVGTFLGRFSHWTWRGAGPRGAHSLQLVVSIITQQPSTSSAILHVLPLLCCVQWMRLLQLPHPSQGAWQLWQAHPLP